MQDNLLLPFVGLMLLGGLYLTIKLRLYRFPYQFLGLRILSGTLDWKARKGKLSPAQAIAAGALYNASAGAALGAVLGYQLAGPGILPWVWISAFLVMPFELTLGTLSHRFRERGPGNLALTGPHWLMQKGLRATWLAHGFALVFALCAIVMGALVPASLLDATFFEFWDVPTSSLTILLLIALILIVTGGIRRIGRFTRYASPTFFVVAVIATVLLLFQSITHTSPPDSGFLKQMAHGFFPRTPTEGLQISLGLACYWCFAAGGGGTLATFAGTIRTQHSAKAGLATLPATLLAGFVSSTLTVYLLHRAGPDVLGFAFGPSAGWLAFAALGALAIIVTLGATAWLYSGWQAARFAGGRSGGAGYIVLFLVSLVSGGFLLELEKIDLQTIIALGAITFSLSGILAMTAAILRSRTAGLELQLYMETDQARSIITRDLLLLFFHALPGNTVSRLFGWFSYTRFPRPIMRVILRVFANSYRINLDEMEGTLEDYRSLNLFFTRPLRAGVRPVDRAANVVVSPVDGMLSRMGPVEDGLMIQAKGMMYSAADLLEGSAFAPGFEGGQYCVLYLSPQDYHRLHSPAEGRVLGYSYQPGRLFPVNMLAVHGLHGLFPKNERLTTYIDTGRGKIAVVKVGATNVGRIRVTYDRMRTNRWFRRPRAVNYEHPPTMERGAELGRFEMGSTVILMFEPGTFRFDPEIKDGTRMQYGQRLGVLQRRGRK